MTEFAQVFQSIGAQVAYIRTVVVELPHYDIVVVDDRIGPRYQAVFHAAQALGVHLITHEHNRGNGAALKTRFSYVHDTYPDKDVVCVDRDGQHRPDDIERSLPKPSIKPANAPSPHLHQCLGTSSSSPEPRRNQRLETSVMPRS